MLRSKASTQAQTTSNRKNYGGKVIADLKGGFDSDGEVADVVDIDDKPSQPLQTSMNQYETPSKRELGVLQAEAYAGSRISGQGKGGRHVASQGVQGEETSSQLTRFMDDFYAKRGFFGPGGQNLKKKSVQTKGDDYYNSLESLVDKYLTQVAQRIAQKRSLEVENSQLRSAYNKLNADINEADKTQQKLLFDKQKAENLNATLHSEVNNLKDQHALMMHKIELQKSEFKQQLLDLETKFERMRDNVENEGAALQDSKSDIHLRKQALANEIKDLERRFLEADKAYILLEQKHAYSQHLQESRIQKMRDKAKILSSLMANEDLALGGQDISKNSVLTKNISKILVSGTQSPQKGAVTRASHNASMSIAKAHGVGRASVDLGGSMRLNASSKQSNKF